MARAYLVRTIEDHDLVGIFVAENRLQLEMIVDECVDADACEYAPMSSGAMFWTSPAIEIPPPQGDEDSEDDDPAVPFAAASLSENWWDASISN
jgi:hypothetical protein